MSLVGKATSSTSTGGVSSDKFVETDNSVTIFSPSGESHFSIKDYLARVNVPLEPWEDGEHNLGNEDHSWKDIYIQGFLRAGVEFGILDGISTRYYHDAVQTVLASPDGTSSISITNGSVKLSNDSGVTFKTVATTDDVTNKITRPGVDGVVEVGQYLDFHEVGSDEVDFDSRLMSIDKVLYTMSGNSVVPVGLNSSNQAKLGFTGEPSVGEVGEIISASGSNSFTAGTTIKARSLKITAGTWIISGNVFNDASMPSGGYVKASLNLAYNTHSKYMTTQLDTDSNENDVGFAVKPMYITVSSDTNVYINVERESAVLVTSLYTSIEAVRIA